MLENTPAKARLKSVKRYNGELRIFTNHRLQFHLVITFHYLRCPATPFKLMFDATSVSLRVSILGLVSTFARHCSVRSTYRNICCCLSRLLSRTLAKLGDRGLNYLGPRNQMRQRRCFQPNTLVVTSETHPGNLK
jgi:hypothetical protein